MSLPADAPEQRWRALAAEARACLAGIAEPEARRIMQEIVTAFDFLEKRANAHKQRKVGH